MSIFSHHDMSDSDRIKALEVQVAALEARLVALDDRVDLDMRRIDAQLTAQQRSQPWWKAFIKPGTP